MKREGFLFWKSRLILFCFAVFFLLGRADIGKRNIGGYKRIPYKRIKKPDNRFWKPEIRIRVTYIFYFPSVAFKDKTILVLMSQINGQINDFIWESLRIKGVLFYIKFKKQRKTCLKYYYNYTILKRDWFNWS